MSVAEVAVVCAVLGVLQCAQVAVGAVRPESPWGASPREAALAWVGLVAFVVGVLAVAAALD